MSECLNCGHECHANEENCPTCVEKNSEDRDTITLKGEIFCNECQCEECTST